MHLPIKPLIDRVTRKGSTLPFHGQPRHGGGRNTPNPAQHDGWL